MKKLLLVLATVIIVSTLIFGGCATSAPSPATPSPAAQSASEPINLKFVSFLTNVYPDNVFMNMFIDKVNEKAKGELVIQYIGGPEAIPQPDQAAAVQRGAVDMGDVFTGIVDGIAPGVGCMEHMEITLEEFRNNGAYDLAAGILMDAGIFFLGQGQPSKPQTKLNYFSKPKIEKPEDFAGLKIALPNPAFVPFTEALGATPAIIGLPDYYTALERGTVDGYNLGMPGVLGFGLAEVTDYVIDEPYSSSGSIFIVNLDKWNALPKNLQDIMIQSAIEVEQEGVGVWDKLLVELKSQLEKDGVEYIKFSPADSAKFHAIYKGATWGMLKGRYPDIAPKFEKLIAP